MAQAQNPEFFETRSISRLLIEFSLPAIAASIVTSTYSLVARVFVAQRFGTDGVAAVTVSFPVIVVFLAVAMTIGTGTVILISLNLGEKKLDKAEEAMGQALFLSAATAAIFVFFGLTFLEPILRFTGANDAIMPLAKEYLSFLIWGVFPQHIAFGVNHFIRAEGKPRIAMITMFFSAILNGVLDYVFLFVFKTGIWGAGCANVIACSIVALWICWLYLSDRTILKWRWKYFRFNWKLAREIAICGAVPFAAQACSAVLQTTQNNLLGHYGALYGAARGYAFDGGVLAIGIMGTIVAIAQVFLMPLLGLSQGVQPIIGYNCGANRPDRAHATISLAMKIGVIGSSLALCLVLWRPEWFVNLFLKSDEIGFEEKLDLGKTAIRAIMLAQPFVAVNVLASGYFQAQGRPILALMMTLCRQLLFLIPCLVFSTWLVERIWPGNGLNGCWYSFPISDIFACILALVFLRVDSKRKRNARDVEAAQ